CVATRRLRARVDRRAERDLWICNEEEIMRCSHCAGHSRAITRRFVLAGFSCSALSGGAVASASTSTEIAGVSLPRSDIARRAMEFSRSACPDFLFNHCMRTYLFGALFAHKNQMSFDADEAFTAAALHDLGLLSSFASSNGSFELDGARAAEQF